MKQINTKHTSYLTPREALNSWLLYSAFIIIDVYCVRSSFRSKLDTAYFPDASLGYETQLNKQFATFLVKAPVSLYNTRIPATAAREARHIRHINLRSWPAAAASLYRNNKGKPHLGCFRDGLGSGWVAICRNQTIDTFHSGIII